MLPQLLTSETNLVKEFNNDIYSQYMCYPHSRFSTLKGTIIYPATAKHLDKFSEQNLHFVYETQEDYESITLPFIEEQSFSFQVSSSFVRRLIMFMANYRNLIFDKIITFSTSQKIES